MFTRDDFANLIEDRKSVMAQLALLPDCRATAPRDPNTSNVRTTRTAASAPPPEVDLDAINRPGPPSKDRSLYAHYEWRFDACDRAVKAAPPDRKPLELLRMQTLIIQARRDLFMYRGQHVRPTSDTDAANVDRVLTEYEGVPAGEVAIWEMCPVAWVRKARVSAGLNGEDGLRRPRSARDHAILRLAAQELPVRAIAQQVGASKSTVSRVLAAA